MLMIDNLKIRIRFTDRNFPYEFFIEAGQRYPHLAPRISYRNQIPISSASEYTSCPDLLSHWTPIMGLLDVIYSLHRFRQERESDPSEDMHLVINQDNVDSECSLPGLNST